MLRELAGKRSAEVRILPALPIPHASEQMIILRAQSKTELIRRVARGQDQGRYGACSEVLHVSDRLGGGYAVKVVSLVRPSEPLPMWSRILIRVGFVLIGVAVAMAALVAALSALVGSLLALPWAVIGGCAVLVFILGMFSRSARRAVRVIVDVTVR